MTRGRSTALPVVRRDEFEQEVLQAEGPVLVELGTPDADYPHVVSAVQEAISGQSTPVKMVRINLSEYEDFFAPYRENKGYNTYDFDKLPAFVLFRNGNLVTTFNPTFSSANRNVQAADAKRQMRFFLGKFVNYDPEKVTFNHNK